MSFCVRYAWSNWFFVVKYSFFCVFVIIISVHKISEVIERAMSKNIIDEMRAFYHFQEIHYVHFHSLDILEMNYLIFWESSQIDADYMYRYLHQMFIYYKCWIATRNEWYEMRMFPLWWTLGLSRCPSCPLQLVFPLWRHFAEWQGFLCCYGEMLKPQSQQVLVRQELNETRRQIKVLLSKRQL